jgi:hypothetical protein
MKKAKGSRVQGFGSRVKTKSKRRKLEAGIKAKAKN